MTDNTDNPEAKRVFPRFPVDMPVEMEFGEGGVKEVNHLVKIAIGGAAAKSSQKPLDGDIVLLRIPADNPSFEAKGEVRWVKPSEGEYEIGFKFVEMSGEAIDGLHSLLRTVMPSQYHVGEPDEDIDF